MKARRKRRTKAIPASQPGGFKPKGFVWNAWAKGYKLGIQAASDHLSTHISYACTISPDGTRKGLLDAMRARHSYGATDNIVLDYRLVAQVGKRVSARRYRVLAGAVQADRARYRHAADSPDRHRVQ